MASLDTHQLTVFDVLSGEVIASADVAGQGLKLVEFSDQSDVTFAVMGKRSVTMYELEECGEIKMMSSRTVDLAALPKAGLPSRRKSIIESLDLGQLIDTSKTPVACSMTWWQDVIFVGTEQGVVYRVDGETEEAKAITSISKSKKSLSNPGKIVSIVVAGSTLVCGGSEGVLRTYAIGKDMEHEGDVALPGTLTSVAMAGESAVVAGPGYHAVLERNAGEGAHFQEAIVLDTYHTGAIIGAGFAANVPVSFDANGLGLMWDGEAGASVTAKVKTQLKPMCMSACPSGPAVTLGTTEGVVNLYDTTDPSAFKLVFSQQLHKGPVTHIEYCRSGEYIFSVGAGSLVVTRANNNATVVGALDVPANVMALGCSSPESNDGGVRVVLTAPQGYSGSSVISAYFRPPAILESAVPFLPDTIYYHEASVDFRATSVAFGRGDQVFVAGMKDRVCRFVWADNQFQASDPALFSGCPAALHPTLAMASGGHVLASLGTDGTLLVRSALADGELNDIHLSFGHPLPPAPTTAESVTLEKLTAALHAAPVVAVSSDGTKVLTASSTKGDLICWQFDSGAASAVESAFSVDLSDMAERAEVAVGAGAAAVSTKTKTAVDQLLENLELSKVDASTVKAEGAENPLVAKIAGIREQLANMMSANDDKPELEMLERQEFQLDLAAKDRMVAEGEQKLQDLRDDLELQILAQQFLRNEVKKECWDAMEVKGKTLYALQSGLEVSNYPIRKRSDDELAELARVKTMRSIELAQEKAARRRLQKEQAAAAASSPAPGDVSAASPEPGTASPPPVGEADAGGDDDDEEEETDLYNPLTLYGAQRKRAQIELLKNEIYLKQVEFNKDFESLCMDKEAVLRQIDTKNGAISKVVAELRLGGAADLEVVLFAAEKHVLETPEKLLEVDKSEIKVVKVLNAEELILKAEDDKKEAERKALEALDNPIERGIQDMLDGRLEEKGAEEVWEDLPVPEFMATPEDRWTDAQTKVADAFKKEVKERDELRDKRRKLIQSDLTSLKAGVATSISQFDDRLNDFFHKKIRLQQIFIREELKILKLAKALRDEQEILGQEKALSMELQDLRGKIRETDANWAAAKEVVSAHEAEYTTTRRADTQLDKTFKVRFVKESSNPGQAEDYIDMLAKLFKKRPRKSKMVGLHELPEDELALDSSPEGDDYPEGLDRAVWDELVVMRNEKLASEAKKRAKEADVADKRAFLNRRKVEAKAKVDRQAAVLEELGQLRKSRLNDALNLEIVVKIKQGQVEIAHSDDFEPDYDSAVLIDRSAVETLNEEVVKLAEVKVQHMTEKMKKQSGIHKLEWEHRRLGMEAEDLHRKTKDIQMLRVTRHMTLDGDSGTEDRNRKANDTLEQTIKQQEKLVKTQLADRKRQAMAITRKIRGLKAETVRFEPEITELSNTVDERATMCRVHMAATGGKSKTDARLHAASSRRALVETVKAQADEISFLRDELERRRMKTFPAFIPGQHVAF